MSGAVDWDDLRQAAREARSNAYAPYSSQRVGAAVLASGRVFAGCNVENASYPVGLCAERAALAAAVSAGCRELRAVAIVSDRGFPPCGMCRQALAEFSPDVPLLLVGDDREVETSLARLLPDPFSPPEEIGRR